MHKQIVCLSDARRQYLEIFRPCFRKHQWKYFVIVLLGLVECEEPKTLSGLMRWVAERASLSGMSRFLSKWPWSTEAVAITWMKQFRERMEHAIEAEHQRLKKEMSKHIGRPKATVVTGYFIFDDSVHIKPKGCRMGGLGCHYSSTEQRNVKGHCLFTGFYVLLGQRCPLPMQMYRQKSVCDQEGVAFESKIDLAVHQIEAFQPANETQTHVLVDSRYHCREVRRSAQQRGWEVSGGLRSNRWMRWSSEKGERRWFKLSAYAASLKRADWQEVVWPSVQGGQKMYAHLVQTWIRKLGPTTLLITCHDLDQPLKSVRYWGSTLFDVQAQELMDMLAIRWEIETFFEYDKDLLGSDHYQLMSVAAVVRF